MHGLTADDRAELRIGVQPVLLPTPVELPPARHQAPEPGQRHAVGTLVAAGGRPRRPASEGKTLLEVIQVPLRDPGGERLDHEHARRGASRESPPSSIVPPQVFQTFQNGMNSSTIAEQIIPFQVLS
jgi:hypothetical protein